MASTLPIVWELSKFHTTLVNTWLLREFHTRGAPPVQSDLELIAKLSTALEAFQNQAREISTKDVKEEAGAHKEVLQRIQGMPSVPLDLRERARYLLRRINFPEAWPEVLNRCRCSKPKPAERPILIGDLPPELTVHYQNILFMPEYQSLSLEELRLADYALGFKYGTPGGTEFVAYKEVERSPYYTVHTNPVYTTYYFQNLLFTTPYKNKDISLEELRLADYTRGRKYGVGKANFEAYQETIMNPEYVLFTFHNIFSKLPYWDVSPEELRLVDYAEGRKYGTEGGVGVELYTEVRSSRDEELIVLTEDTIVAGSKKEGREGNGGGGGGGGSDEGNQKNENNEQDSVTSKETGIQKKDIYEKEVEEENKTLDEKKLIELPIRGKDGIEGKDIRDKEVDNSSNISESENQEGRGGEYVHTTPVEKEDEEHDKETKG